MRYPVMLSETLEDFLLWSSFEGFFASKGAAYALPDGDFARRATKHGGEMQLHLQDMVNLLRDEDVLRLVIKLESQYPNRIRYLTIVSAFGPDDEEQSIVMGVDWTDKATIGLVVPLYRDTVINLDGDGGFKMTSAGTANIFKPISVQTMWTALQWIHKCTDIARRNNYFFPNGSSHTWAQYYYRKITSDRICLNEWHQMEDLESKRPDSPIGTSTEKELVMKLIRHKLKEVMMKVDLEEVTSRQVRTMLEGDTQIDLKEYRSFIDEEMITILGQMDSASKIFDHVYLGSEWNASNLEELKENGVGYILNITREIDNFFPGTFCYHNIRVYDLDETELLHHWDNTYKFIQRAKKAGSKVLVHCRMGISRSASTVIAYGMKEYGWSLGDTMKYVKARRSVVQPNAGFWKQLITYEGILNSSKQRYNKLFKAEPEASDVGAVRKKKKPGNTANKSNEQPAQPQGMDTTHYLPIKTASDIICQHPSEETVQDSGVVRVTTEGIGDTLPASEALSEHSRDGDSVMMASSPVNSTADSGKDLVGETAPSRVLELAGIENTALYRVSSVPTLPSGDKRRQLSNAETSNNFQRSSSLRERRRRNRENLRALTGDKAASDENMTEFGLKQKEVAESSVGNFCVKEPDAELQQSKLTEKESIVEDSSCDGTEMEHQDSGSLPSELHGVLESGFVKRCSRNFEEGVYNVPSVLEVLEGSRNLEEEMDVECAAGESNEPSTELSESTTSEEPAPGVVKKHKEEYELKHWESLKRGAVLQRSGSGDRVSLKRERGEIPDDSYSKAEEGSEDDSESAVNVDVLVQKVNEDMKKEVSVRRISKKELELHSFVQQEGEQMEDAVANGQALDNSVIDTGSQGSSGEPSSEEKVKEFLLEEPQSTETSAECKETFSSNQGSAVGELHSGVVHDLSAEVFRSSDDIEDTTSEQNKESIPQKGLVKRHTLLIEGRLQSFSDKNTEGEDEKEGELTVSQKSDVGLPLEGKARGFAAETLQANVTKDVNTTEEVESTEKQTRDVPCERKDLASGQDDEVVPHKGLVKRHTLLIEEKLQPLEQVSFQNDHNEASEENTKGDQETSAQPLKDEVRGTGSDSAERMASVGTDVKAEGEPTEKEIAAERKEPCELLDDKEDRATEQDIENVLPKGLVKRHTLLIEGKLLPGGEEDDKEAKNQDENKDDSTIGTRSTSLDSEQVAPDVASDVSVEDRSPSDETEDRTSKASEQDAELPSEKGLVKRHTLLIERQFQPLDQGVEDEDKKLGEEKVCQEVCSSDPVDEQQRYQIELSNKTSSGQTEEETPDSEMVSGLVKREKVRIEEREKPVVVEASALKQDENLMLTCNDGTVQEAGIGAGENCGEAEEKDDEKDHQAREQLIDQKKVEVGVDTSSVVRVKDHTQHLEGIIRVTTTAKDAEKPKSLTSKQDISGSSDEPPRIVLISRSYSGGRTDQEMEPSSSEKLLEDRMEEILSDSAVNTALLKAQENLNLENERFVDWDVANVKQRTRIFEEIVRHVDSNSRKDDQGSDSPIRRCDSLPKTIRPSQKYVLHRRSFSDVSETVSSSSGREVGYTIHFSNGESSSSSSLPRDWSLLLERQKRDGSDEREAEEVFSPDIYNEDGLKKNIYVELNDCGDKENDSRSVEEKMQVLDSKNQKNMNNVS